MTNCRCDDTIASAYGSRGKRRRPAAASHQASRSCSNSGNYPRFFWKLSTEYLLIILILASNNHHGRTGHILVSAQQTLTPSMISTSDPSESATMEDVDFLTSVPTISPTTVVDLPLSDPTDLPTTTVDLTSEPTISPTSVHLTFEPSAMSPKTVDDLTSEPTNSPTTTLTSAPSTMTPTTMATLVGGDKRQDPGEGGGIGDICIPVGTERCAVAKCPDAPDGCHYKTDHYVMGLFRICCPKLCHLVDSNNPEMECGSSPSLLTTASPTTEVTDQTDPPPTASPTLLPYIKTLPPTPDPTSVLSSPATPPPTLVGSNRQDITPGPAGGGGVPIQTLPEPTDEPTMAPTIFSSNEENTIAPFQAPPLSTDKPTLSPSQLPTSSPNASPSSNPSDEPTIAPITSAPTWNPTAQPTESPTISPSSLPSGSPTDSPTASPTTPPSQSPSNTPTARPTITPSEAPTITPSKAPTMIPSSQPSPIPTPIPTPYPTAAPVPWPTREPTPSPTISPTTAPPTPDPTSTPSLEPSDIPSTTPTFSPTSLPSSTPSDTPSLVPTISALPTTETPKPTVSSRPSEVPSVSPTDHPSSTPTDYPSTFPSQLPSELPSANPSQSPSLSLQNEGERVEMTLKHSDVLEGLSIITWEQITATHIRQSILKMDVDPPMDDLRVWTNIVRQTPQQVRTVPVDGKESGADSAGADSTVPEATETAILSESRNAANNQEEKATPPIRTGAGSGVRGRRRQLQQQQTQQPQQEDGNVPLKIAFDTAVSYRSIGQDHDIQALISGAFDNAENREQYINSLKRTNDGAFQNLNEVVSVSVDGEVIPEEEETTPRDDEGRDMTIFIIIGAAAGGGALILLILFLLWRKYATKNHQHQSVGKTETNANTLYDSNANGVTTEIVVEHNPDEVSTLGDPTFTPNGMMMGMMNTMEREEERTASVGDDYDYKYLKHHNFSNNGANGSAARNRLMSDGEDTRSRLTSDEDLTRQSSGKTTSQSKLGLSQMGESIFSDDASFEEQYTESPEEQVPFEITVPAGKLGMVIDTPNGGFPIVHAIKDTSILADRVRVGDRLVSVDGQDCTPMTAVQVSKLISLKSEQETRVLVFVRKRGATRPGGG